MSRIDKAHYVKYKDKCAILWFAPRDEKSLPTTSKQEELKIEGLNQH